MVFGDPDVWARTVTSLARVHGSLFSAGTRPKPFSCRLGLRERARRGSGTRRYSNHTDTRPRAAGTGSRGGQLGSRRAGSVPGEEGGALSGTRPAGLRQLTRSSAAAQTSWHRTVETEGPVLTPRWIDGGARGPGGILAGSQRPVRGAGEHRQRSALCP